MRPLAVLIGIVTGSALSLAVGLTLTWIVLLFLPAEQADQFAGERAPLLQAMALFALMAATSGASFYAELRTRPWRYAAYASALAVLGLTIWTYWPR